MHTIKVIAGGLLLLGLGLLIGRWLGGAPGAVEVGVMPGLVVAT